MNREDANWLIVMVYAAALMWLAIMHVPGRLSGLSAWHMDKLAHAGMYGLLGLLLGRSLWRSGSGVPKGLVATCAAGMAIWYGVVTESLQADIGWRSKESMDILANAAGAVLGGLVWTGVETRGPRDG